MAASAAIAAAGENMNALTATKSENALDPITCLLRQPQEPISLGGKAFATWWYSPGNVVAVAQQVQATRRPPDVRHRKSWQSPATQRCQRRRSTSSRSSRSGWPRRRWPSAQPEQGRHRRCLTFSIAVSNNAGKPRIPRGHLEGLALPRGLEPLFSAVRGRRCSPRYRKVSDRKSGASSTRRPKLATKSATYVYPVIPQAKLKEHK